MISTVVATVFNADMTRQVEVFQRRDGSFGFEELRFSEPERSWIVSGCYSNSFTDSTESALREARERVLWLSLGGEDN